ncbi:MAG: hypothetical protein ACPIOQ_03860 [Promethearchaeia archaeon]
MQASARGAGTNPATAASWRAATAAAAAEPEPEPEPELQLQPAETPPRPTRPVLSRTSSLEALFKLTRLDDGRCEYSLPIACRSRQVVPDREFVSTVVGVPCAGERGMTLPCAHASSASLVCGGPPGTRAASLRSLATCHPSSVLARSVQSLGAGVGSGGNAR